MAVESPSNAYDLLGRGFLQAARMAEPSESRRSLVLDAASGSLVDFGIRHTSMGEVARRSGVSEATLFRWYRTKGDLVTEVIAREIRVVLGEMEGRIDPAAPAIEQLADALADLAGALRVHPLLVRLKVTDPDVIVPANAKSGSWVLEMGASRLGAWISRFQLAGDLPEFDPAPPAEALARLVHSLVVTTSDTMALSDPEQLRDTLRAVAFGVLQPRNASSAARHGGHVDRSASAMPRQAPPRASRPKGGGVPGR